MGQSAHSGQETKERVGLSAQNTLERHRMDDVPLSRNPLMTSPGKRVSPKAAVAAPVEMNVEVLGNRARCDVRYQEYQAFKRNCMGEKYSDND